MTMSKLTKTDDEWRDELTPEQYRICRERGTEAAFSGAYWDCHDEGTYRCVCCGTALFDSEAKFESGCGWPSFSKAYSSDNIYALADNTHGMERIEVRCKQCDAHLGHIFPDGPPPSGLRFCINSASLALDRK